MRSAVPVRLAVGVALALTPATASATVPGTWRRLPAAPIAPDAGAGALDGSSAPRGRQRLRPCGGRSGARRAERRRHLRPGGAALAQRCRRRPAIPVRRAGPMRSPGPARRRSCGGRARTPRTRPRRVAGGRCRGRPRTPPASSPGRARSSSAGAAGAAATRSPTGSPTPRRATPGGASPPRRSLPASTRPGRGPAWSSSSSSATATRTAVRGRPASRGGGVRPGRRSLAADRRAAGHAHRGQRGLGRPGAALVGGTTGTGTALARVGLAYDPATDAWRRLAACRRAVAGAAAVSAGSGLLLWGGSSQAGQYTVPAHGLAYDPAANRWDDLPPAPVLGRVDPIAAWTGEALLVWGGTDPYRPFADGAEFVPVPLDRPSGRS